MVLRTNHPFPNSSRSSAMRSMVPTPRQGRACCLTAANREGEVVHDGLMTPWVSIYRVWPMFWSFFTASGCFYCSSVSAWFCTEAAAVDKLLTCGYKDPIFYQVDSNQGGLWWFAGPSIFVFSPNYDPHVYLKHSIHAPPFLYYREPECKNIFYEKGKCLCIHVLNSDIRLINLNLML